MQVTATHCFVQQGYDLGIKNNKLVLGDKTTALTRNINDKEVKLHLFAKPQLGAVALTLTASFADNNQKIAQL